MSMRDRLLPEGDWRRRAACLGRDPALFYPLNGGGSYVAVRKAKAICAGCEVRQECLEFALASETVSRDGVWGGTTPQERRSIVRRRRLLRRERVS